MTSHATVGVHYNLAASETSISIGAADDETTSGIDKELGVSVDELLGENLVEDVLLDVGMNLLLGDNIVVLGGENHGLQAKGCAVLVVLQ